MGNVTWGEVKLKEVIKRELEDPSILEMAMESWKEGDVVGVLEMMSNELSMGFVIDNWPLLKKIGKYEEALLHAYQSIRTNYSTWSMDLLRILFMQADIEKLRKVGDPIPDQETFILYRGVSGVGRKRRVSSLSWTESPNTAAWFAKRYGLPDPAVFMVTVPKESIMACSFDRNEREYLLRLPLPVKPKRLKEMPEAFLPRDKEKLGGGGAEYRKIFRKIRKKTAQCYARGGMPFFRDPGGRPIAKPSMIDEYILDLNRSQYDDKVWKDKGIKIALAYEDYDEKERKDFDERFIQAQKPPRSRY